MNLNLLTLEEIVEHLLMLSDAEFGKLLRLVARKQEPDPEDVALMRGYNFLKVLVRLNLSEKRRMAANARWENSYPQIIQKLSTSEDTHRDNLRQIETDLPEIYAKSDLHKNYANACKSMQTSPHVSSRLYPSHLARAGSLVLSITSNENTSTSNKNLLLVKKKESIAKERKKSDPAPGPQTSRLPQAKFACCSLFSFSSFPEPWAAYCQASRPELDATKVYHKFLDFYNERSIQRTESEWFDAFRKWVDDEVADESNTAQNVITISRLRKIAFQIANSGSYCYSRYSQGTSSPAELADRLFEYGSRYRSDFDYVIKKAICCRVLKDMFYRPGFEFKEVKVVPNDSEHQQDAMSLMETLTDTTRIN